MDTLDRMQKVGLFQNLEVHTPPKNHKVVMHKKHKWAANQKGKTIMVITTDGQLLRVCEICNEVHSEGDCGE